MINLKSKLRSFLKAEEGTAAVEFGLIALGFVAILMGITETGRLFLTWNTFQYAVENATRYALANEDVTEAELQDYIRENMEDFTVPSDGVDIDVTFPVLNEVNFVEINGTYSYEVIAPFLPDSWNSIELTASSRLPRP